MPARPEFKSEELSQTGRNPLCRVLLMEGDGVPSLRCPPANRHPVSEKAPVDPTHWSGAFSFSLISYRAGAKARPRHEEKVGRAIRPHRARDKKLVPMATSSRDFF
jgi:hypothetical protein